MFFIIFLSKGNNHVNYGTVKRYHPHKIKVQKHIFLMKILIYRNNILEQEILKNNIAKK